MLVTRPDCFFFPDNEDPEDYEMLKYHPVHIGEVLVGNQSSYRIDEKLDIDQSGIYWAVFDLQAGFHRKITIESAIFTEKRHWHLCYITNIHLFYLRSLDWVDNLEDWWHILDIEYYMAGSSLL